MTTALTPSALMTPLVASAAMRAIMDDRAHLQRMLNFEAALARAEAAVAAIPAGCVGPISGACKVEHYDLAALGEAAVRAGNIAAPLIAALTEMVAKTDAEAARFVHWAASEQDLIDSALMLQLRAAIDALITDLNTAIDGFTAMAGRHRRTAAVARTSLQHALPMPFGLKLAGYASALARSRERLRRLRKEAVVLQFGGAAGTLAALGENGLAVTDRLAALLDLPAPEAPWHAHSDRVADIASALAILAGTCGKIARDLALLMQSEVGEVREPARAPPGETAGAQGMDATGKRNSSLVGAGITAASLAPNLLAAIIAGQMQEHERGLGGSQVQGHALPALLLVTSGALAAVAELSQGLEIDAERMRNNLDVTHGLIMIEAVVTALAAKLGPQEARLIVEDASKQAIATKRHLSSILAEDARVTAHMTPGELARPFELLGYQGIAQTYIDRLISSLGARAPKR
jgi:3-carboxy-cis,cis-muconate cycloisomerase